MRGAKSAEEEMELRRMDQEHKVRHGDDVAAAAPPRGGGGGKFSSFGLGSGGGGDEQSGKTPFTAAESSLPNSFRGK